MLLHIVQGGVDNGDKDWLERASRRRLRHSSWVAPKRVAVGDEVVIYVAGHGLFATARIDSEATPRSDWVNRYGAALTDVRLITPPISINTILRRVPSLTWARYPRSITTPSPVVSRGIKKLIEHRRRTGLP